MKNTSIILATVFSLNVWADPACTTYKIVDYTPPGAGNAGLTGASLLIEKTDASGAKSCVFVDHERGFLSAPALFNNLLKTPLTAAQIAALKSTDDGIRKPPKPQKACDFSDNSRVEIQDGAAFTQAILSMVNGYGEANKLNANLPEPTYKTFDMVISPNNNIKDLKPLVDELKASTSISLQAYCKLGYFAFSPPSFATKANDQIMSLPFIVTKGACKGSINQHAEAFQKAYNERKPVPSTTKPSSSTASSDGIPTGTYDRATGTVGVGGTNSTPAQTDDSQPIYGRTYIVGKNRQLANKEKNTQTFQALMPNWFNAADASGCVPGIQGKFTPAAKSTQPTTPTDSTRQGGGNNAAGSVQSGSPR